MNQPTADTAASTDGLDPPLCTLPINTADSGFYHGFNKLVSISSKLIVSALILWTLLFPIQAGETLAVANATLIRQFAGWYVYLVALIMAVALVLAVYLNRDRFASAHRGKSLNSAVSHGSQCCSAPASASEC